MANTRTVIGLKVKLSGKEQARKELNNIIKYLEGNSKISLKFDTKGMTQSLNEFSKALDGISSKMNGAFKSEGAKKTTTEIKKATKANKEFEKSLGIAGIEKGYKQLQARARELQNTMQSLAKIDVTRNAKGGVDKAVLSYTDQLGNTIKETMAWQNKTDKAGKVVSSVFKTIKTQAVDNIAKVQQMNTKLDATKAAMQGKLNNATQLNSLNNNSFIDPNVLANIQARLNAITTTTPKKEIKELQTVINNLGSGNSGIVKVQSKITSMVDGLAKMKAKYGDLVGDSHSLAQLQAYETEIEKLKTLLASLKSGNVYSPIAISNATTNATNSSRNLTTAIQTSSRAMRTGGQDAISFGGNLKKAFNNAGFYMSTYMVMQKVFRQIKEGISYVKYLDDSFTDMAMTMNITKEGFNGMSAQIDTMAKKLGVTSQYVHDIAKLLANLYRNI